MWLGGLHGCNEWAGQTGRSGFSGGLLWTGADRADSRQIGQTPSYWAEYRTGWTGADGVDWQTDGRSGVRNPGRGGLGQTGWLGGLEDAADYGILDGVDWGGRGGLVDGRTGGRGGLRNPGWGGVGRTGRTGADGADGAEWRTRRTGADEAEGSVLGRAWRGVRSRLGNLERACQQTERTDWNAHVQVDWPLCVLGPRGFQEC